MFQGYAENTGKKPSTQPFEFIFMSHTTQTHLQFVI